MNNQAIIKLMSGMRWNNVNGEDFIKKLFTVIKSSSKLNLQKFAEEPHNYLLAGEEDLAGFNARRKVLGERISQLKVEVEFAKEDYTTILRKLVLATVQEEIKVAST